MKINKIFFILWLLSVSAWAQTPEEKLQQKGITLPAVSAPIASYVNAVRVGNLIYLSGKGPQHPNGTYLTGKLGKDLSIEEGQKAAKMAALAHIAVLKQELGDLSKVKRIVKVTGMVQCTDTFTDQPKVINGYSNFMVEIFGEKGKHARSAVGHNALPMGMAVEVEAIVEILE